MNKNISNPETTQPPPKEDALNLNEETKGEGGPQETKEGLLDSVLQGLPPELKELEGKDLKTVLAEYKKTRESHEEAQRLIGRQGYELGLLRQAFQGIPQQQTFQTQTSPQPTPPTQAGETQDDEEFNVDRLFKTVKQTRQEVKALQQEREKMMASMQAQEVKTVTLGKIPDAGEYADEIRGLSSFVDPRYLVDPRSWQMIYLTAKSLKEAAKQFPVGGSQGVSFPQSQQAPAPNQQPSGSTSQPFGDIGGTKTSGKKPLKIPEDVRKGMKKMSKLGISEEDLEKYLREE